MNDTSKSLKKLFNSNNLLTTDLIDNPKININPDKWFALEKAKQFGATAVYFRTLEGRQAIPQIYIYNFTGTQKTDKELSEIHKKVWSSGNVPLVYIIDGSHLSILDCTQPININGDQEEPYYLERQISLLNEVDDRIKEYSSQLLDSGIFWEKNIRNSNFSFDNSAYKLLLGHLKSVKDEFIKKYHFTPFVAQKLIVQCILIKYIEERVGEDEKNRAEMTAFYNQFDGAENLCDVLRKQGQTLNLLSKLNTDKFHGRIFEWSEEAEIVEIKEKENKLYKLAEFLEGDIDIFGQKAFWRMFSFNYLPVELISRLYEEFLGKDDEGVVFTPPHLANFLVDECMSLSTPINDIKLDYKILDPSCGSGIFLVTAFKRLIQWWRIKNKFTKANNLEVIKKLLRENIYGIDLAKEAVHLTTFSLSLAICDMIEPALIWHNLTFDDLKEENIITENYFKYNNLNATKFDLVIGNPPFSTKLRFERNWKYEVDKTFIIPRNQIALKFLGETIANLKDGGIQCLIMPASGLLHNEYATKFKEIFFAKYNVLQLIDFTALARNHVLWDYKEPATVAIFVRKERPNKKNILHLVIKRTKAASERLLFEIDDYDHHFVTREEAITCRYIWKLNLLGGGRLKEIIDKLEALPKLKDYIETNRERFGFDYGEGSGKDDGEAMLPSIAIDENGINYNYCKKKTEIVHHMNDRKIFHSPHLIIKLNSGEKNIDKNIPIELSDKYLSFKKHISAITSKPEHRDELLSIEKNLKTNMQHIRFFLYCTSSELLVGRNTSLLHKEFFSIPFAKKKFKLLPIENEIMNDILDYVQDFLRYGESSVALTPIENYQIILNYSYAYTSALNSTHGKNAKSYQLKHFGITGDFIYTHFEYTKNLLVPQERKLDFESAGIDIGGSEFQKIFNLEIHESLITQRIIKIYRNESVFILKPNQLRFWIKSIAYRDADKTFLQWLKPKNSSE